MSLIITFSNWFVLICILLISMLFIRQRVIFLWTHKRFIYLRYDGVFINRIYRFAIRKWLFSTCVTTTRKYRLEMILYFYVFLHNYLSFYMVMTPMTFCTIFNCCKTISKIVVWWVFFLRFLIYTWIFRWARWSITRGIVSSYWFCSKTTLMFFKCNLAHNYNRMQIIKSRNVNSFSSMNINFCHCIFPVFKISSNPWSV